jgi:hypothetical protein
MTKAFADIAEAHRNDLREVEREIAESNRKLGELATSGVPPIKESDSVSELRDQELRRYWLGLNSEERSQLHADMETGKHRDLAVALLRGPEVVAGLLSARRQRMYDALVPETRRAEAETIKLKAARFEAAHRALRAGNEAARLHAGLQPAEALHARGELTETERLAAEKKAEREERSATYRTAPKSGN